MIKKFFRYLLMGAMHKQRGDRSNLYFSRASFMVSLSTSLYLMSLFQWLLKERYLAFEKWLSEEFSSIVQSNPSFYLGAFLTIAFWIGLFFFFFIDVRQDYKGSKNKGIRYSIFLLYFFASFVAFLFSRAYMLDDL